MTTKKRYPYNPDYAVPPGDTLRETMDALGFTANDVATRAPLPEHVVADILYGMTLITPEIAIRLERAVGIPARLWNALERNYRKQLEKSHAENR